MLPAFAQVFDARVRFGGELFDRSEGDRIGRTRFRARGLEAVLLAIVAERALLRAPVVGLDRDHAERARGHAIAAPVAHVGLHVDVVELVPDDRAGRTRFETAGIRAVLAHVRQHHPARELRLDAVHLLDERDVPPGRGSEPVRIVVRIAAQRVPVGGQLVPLLARDLTRFAADAKRDVGEEPHGLLLV